MTPVNSLYSGPYYGPSDPEKRGPDKGPYIIALKRALSRWSGGEELKWQEFNATYNLALEGAVTAFKKHKGIDTPGSVWGRNAHDQLLHAIRKKEPLEPALDRTAIILMEDAYDLKYPQKRDLLKVQTAIANYLDRMVWYNSRWRYKQQRPMRSIGVAPENGGSDDCSSLVPAACYWARTQTDVFIPDPTGYAYRGYGNTVSLYMQNRERKLGLSAQFQIGDIGLYGHFASRHCVMCRKGGDVNTAIWASHGSDAGPLDCRLLYRDDLFTVVRPILVL